MDWKKELKQRECTGSICNHEIIKDHYLIDEDFIASEIIEKLIDDIDHDEHYKFEDGCHVDIKIAALKQQLKDKWLNN